ncbi:MAG: ankyrin repeat domain-containing protein, partial [Victivallales bacterium]|nr:ankyrin repeat domain-containing protein [Victivallales bacterium]
LDINGRHIDTARFLIAHGADINAKGNGDETLLHCAAKLDIALVRYLVEHGLDVNARNKEGATPLYHAIVNDRLDIAEYLISRGADIATSITGSTPLIVCAAISSSRKTLEYLVKNGVDINATDDDGLNAMHVAAAVNPNTATRRFLAEKGFAEPSESELKKAAKKYKSAYFGFLYHPYTFKHEDIIKYM